MSTTSPTVTHDYDAELVLAIHAEAVRMKATPALAVMDRFGVHRRTAQKWIAKAKGNAPAPTPAHGTDRAVADGCLCSPCWVHAKAAVLRRMGHIPGMAYTRAEMVALDAIGERGQVARRGKFGNSHMLGDLT